MCKPSEISIEKIKDKIRGSKLHVLTFATHEQGYFKTLKESCKNLNINLKVLGMGKKWEGFIAKLVKVKEYLKQCDDKDIILFVDGFDTFFVQPAHVIVERYIINYDNLFVCTSESTYSSNVFFFKIIENMHLIFHNSIFKNNDNTKWDSSNVKKKYRDFTCFYSNLNLLNSGGWISNVFLAKKVLQYIPTFIENDQVFLTNLYLDCNYLSKIEEKKKTSKMGQHEEFTPQKNTQYYNKIIIDNHNVIFHLFRRKSNVKLLHYEDCVRFFPFKPLLNVYYLHGQGEYGETGKRCKAGKYGQTDEHSENSQISACINSLEKNKETAIWSSVQFLKKKKTAIWSAVSFLKKKKKEQDGAEELDGDTKNVKRKKSTAQGGKNETEWMKQKTIWDDVYMDNEERKIGQIEKTFNYSIVDTQTHTSPCILHMHCLRNIDSIILAMGLENIYSSKWYSNIWYLFYSLKGTLNFDYFSLLFSTIVAFVFFFLININYALKCMMYVDTKLGINCTRNGVLSNIMTRLNDIEVSCFLSLALAILFWTFYIFNKSIL
ncbi:procollagen lysine 5-dioxygenase, putative [Plasmodium ovale]|uniref:Procollagen lysine 5-dioxygenase, putative n=2 Tax=Plasmodium ovale TaxID=36330 RepID=A0A1A8W195_PLAOA|nr:procollagen lysine 5-dioxygenase, putative [Plasmodium ovale curtisi]SBS86543.1 procollagen lysine 5-dioxygenase, putative [Plasmodium ovale curtisi]SCQ16287.1 procollagen lysine 5-dioxygenase, putative [Plasmodium ovale]